MDMDSDRAKTFWDEIDFLARGLTASLNYLDQLGAAGLPRKAFPPEEMAGVLSRPEKNPAPARPGYSGRSRDGFPANDFWVEAKNLGELEEKALSCRQCLLSEKRERVVFGRGSAHPLVVVVEGFPDEDEEKSGLAPDGPAAELLKSIMENGLRLTEEDYYVTTAVKCHPPDDRPAAASAAACRKILMAQLAFLKPKMVLALGLTAAEILSGKKLPLGAFRQKTNEAEGFPGLYLRTTFSLRDLLAEKTLKKQSWLDLKPIVPFLEKCKKR